MCRNPYFQLWALNARYTHITWTAATIYRLCRCGCENLKLTDRRHICAGAVEMWKQLSRSIGLNLDHLRFTVSHQADYAYTAAHITFRIRRQKRRKPHKMVTHNDDSDDGKILSSYENALYNWLIALTADYIFIRSGMEINETFIYEFSAKLDFNPKERVYVHIVICVMCILMKFNARAAIILEKCCHRARHDLFFRRFFAYSIRRPMWVRVAQRTSHMHNSSRLWIWVCV